MLKIKQSPTGSTQSALTPPLSVIFLKLLKFTSEHVHDVIISDTSAYYLMEIISPLISGSLGQSRSIAAVQTELMQTQ